MIKEGLYEQIINEEVLENLNELENIKQFSTFNKIGIMAGASTPNEHIEEVRKYCYKLTLK